MEGQIRKPDMRSALNYLLFVMNIYVMDYIYVTVLHNVFSTCNNIINSLVL